MSRSYHFAVFKRLDFQIFLLKFEIIFLSISDYISVWFGKQTNERFNLVKDSDKQNLEVGETRVLDGHMK